MKKLFSLVFLILSLSGCATIVGDKTQRVEVKSNPSGAHFSIKDNFGSLVAEGTTPQEVTLEKSDGSYFGKKSYEITFSKDNYKPVTFPVKASANGWYIAGNLLSWGIVGWLAVDPFNGGMYTLNPKEASVILAPAGK